VKEAEMKDKLEWRYWHEEAPELGRKVAIICNDGCSSGLALMTAEGPLDGEDGHTLWPLFLEGAQWVYLPDDYPLAFMEAHTDV
jgi:hypothetical protein